MHGDTSDEREYANEAPVESRRSARKSKSRRTFRDVMTELRESPKAALAAVAAEAADQVADLRSIITQLHNQLVDALPHSDHHEEVARRGSGGVTSKTKQRGRNVWRHGKTQLSARRGLFREKNRQWHPGRETSSRTC